MNTAKNVLFLGNGFSRSVAPQMPAWKDLFKGENSSIKNYTILYEKKFINNCNVKEEFIKKELIKKIEEEIKKAIEGKESVAEWFGKFLKRNKISDILTTNYDKGIEYILQKCGYEISSDNSSEKLYSIRRCKFFKNKINKHQIKLWKIHGDIDAIKSVILGYDQYCGSLSKLTSYIKGKYVTSKMSQVNMGNVPIEDKCKNPIKKDNGSWAELFFFNNIYIFGFGMDFSELDIWWLLNKRARIKINNPNFIQNTITYYYQSQFDSNREDIKDALKTFFVESKQINDSLLCYMNNIFKV